MALLLGVGIVQQSTFLTTANHAQLWRQKETDLKPDTFETAVKFCFWAWYYVIFKPATDFLSTEVQCDQLERNTDVSHPLSWYS